MAEADALLGIESRGGLVHDDEVGMVDERLGDAEPLFHAAGEAADGAIRDGVEVHRLEHLANASCDRARP